MYEKSNNLFFFFIFYFFFLPGIVVNYDMYVLVFVQYILLRLSKWRSKTGRHIIDTGLFFCLMLYFNNASKGAKNFLGCPKKTSP